MEFKDAVKFLRSELGLTQLELASALHITSATVGRWEKGGHLPSRAIMAALMDFAHARQVSKACLQLLDEATACVVRAKVNLPLDELAPVERNSLRELVENATVPIYVCDMQTDELLYVNRRAEEMLGCSAEEAQGRKCYECIMQRSTPCPFCRKNELTEDRITAFDVEREVDGLTYQVHGKLVLWNGRKAQVRYITSSGAANTMRGILENLNGGVSVVAYDQNNEVRLAYANDRYYALFGYTKEQFISELKDPHDRLHPQDAPQVMEKITNVKKTGQADSFRYRIIKRDGSIAYLRCSSSVSSIKGLGEKVLISVLTDVTGSVRSEQQALVFGQRLNAIIGHIGNGVAASMLDDDGNVQYVFVTDRYYEMLGYTKEQYHAEVKDPFSLITQPYRETVRLQISTLQKLGETIHLKYSVVRRDGTLIHLSVDIIMMAFADVSDRPVMLTVFTDITELVKANEQLRLQRDKISEVLNTTPSGIAIIHLDLNDPLATLKTVYYNDRFYGFSGYTREEYGTILAGDELHFVFEEDKELLLGDTLRICQGAVGDAVSTTVRCHTKDGGYRWLLLTGQLAEKHDSLCVVKIAMVDVTPRKEAEDKLRISEEMLRIAAETDKRALISYDIKANVCQVESRTLYAAKFGERIPNVPAMLVERGIVAKTSTEDLRSMFARLHSGEERLTTSLQMRTGEDEYQWFECNSTVVFDADKKPDRAVLVFHNITEQRVKEAVYRKWRQSILTRPASSYTQFRCNLSRNCELDEQNGDLLKIRFSPKVTMFNERTRLYVEEYVHPDDREAYTKLLDADTLLAMFYRGEHTAVMEYRELDDSGGSEWRRVTIEMVEYINTSDVQVFLMYEDIDEEKRTQLAAQQLAELDPLTGTLNRAAFADKVDKLIKTAPTEQCALLMLDMDNFKLLNDTLGHATGDQALKDVAAVLRSIVRNEDLVCRMGGDEFLVWLRNIPYDAAIGKLAQQMGERIHKDYDQEIRISASIGIAIYPRDGGDFDELYKNADKALYKVKGSGKSAYVFTSKQSDAVEPPQAVDALLVSRQSQSERKIKHRLLIADDNEVNRLMLKRVFKEEYIVETAKNGTEAMLRLRHFGASISVVLLDLIMPEMDGYAVLKKMQNSVDLRTIPVIVVSGDTSHETLLKAVELGAADFMAKPVDIDLLRLRVKSAITKAENERLRAQNGYLQLQRNEEIKFRTVLESTGTVVIEYDWRIQVFTYDNEISKYIAGRYDHRRLWQIFLSDMVADSTDVKAMQDMLLTLASQRGVKQTGRLVMLKTPHRTKHWFRMNIYKSEDEFGLAEKMILTFNDVHDEVLANNKLLFQATRDELTGLYNRAGFIQKATEMIAAKPEGYYVMACVDIEKFKVINDQYGTKKGDEILSGFADTLQRLHQEENGICCRVMADNFAVLYPAVLLNTQELEDSHNAIAHQDGFLPTIHFYVGRCLVDDKTLDVSAIYDRASIAKDTIKGRYDTHIATYNESMRTDILRQQQITGQMNTALTQGLFEVWFQPQFNHATKGLFGAEALVRWRHPEEGIISPGVFIPIFERNGFIYELDKFVWQKICELLRNWLDKGMEPVPISVNISRYDVFRDDLIPFITGLVEKYRLPGNLLRLEITESAFSQSTDQIIHVVERFVELGFIVEIDDFGSGYSSLNTLKDVPAQVLKMDMRFLEKDTNSQRGGSIIESIVRMARWLGMSVIAEGVETVEQADYLRSIGCEHIQGYLYSRPIPMADYEKLLAAGQTQPQLSKLDAVETWNNNAFWNPKSMETLIFNSYMGGACIFEFRNGKTELLRTNAAYTEIFRTHFKHHSVNTREDLFSLLDSENAALVLANIEEAIRTKQAASCTCCMQGDHGELLYLKTTVRQIAQAGDRYLFYCVVSDMTAQRVAEQQQLKTTKQLQAIMDNMNGGVAASVVENGKIRYLFANDRYYELLGYDKHEYQEKFNGVFNAIHPDDRAKTNAAIQKATADGQPYHVDFRIVRKDGTIRWVACNINIIHLPEIDAPVHLAAVTDTTALHEAQRKENATAKQLLALMNDTPGGFVRLKLLENGVAVPQYFNPGFQKLTGMSIDELMAVYGGDVMQGVHPEDRANVQTYKNQLMQDGIKQNVRFRILTKKGDYLWVNFSGKVVKDDLGDTYLNIYYTDATEQIQKEEKRRSLLDNLTCGVALYEYDGERLSVIHINKSYWKLIGRPQTDYSQTSVLDVVHPEDRPVLLREMLASIQQKRNFTADLRVLNGSGGYTPFRVNATLEQEPDGRYLFYATYTLLNT